MATDGSRTCRSCSAAGALPELRLVQQVGAPPRIDDVDAAARATLARRLEGVDGRGAPIAVGVGSRGIAVDRGARAGHDRRAAARRLRAVRRAGDGQPRRRHRGGPAARCWRTTASPRTRWACRSARRWRRSRSASSTASRSRSTATSSRPAARSSSTGSSRTPTSAARSPAGSPRWPPSGSPSRAAPSACTASARDGLRDLIPTVGRYVSERLLLGGLAVVENRLDQTMLVEALRAGGRRRPARGGAARGRGGGAAPHPVRRPRRARGRADRQGRQRHGARPERRRPLAGDGPAGAAARR